MVDAYRFISCKHFLLIYLVELRLSYLEVIVLGYGYGVLIYYISKEEKFHGIKLIENKEWVEGRKSELGH